LNADLRLGLVGAGNMGQALLRGALRAGVVGPGSVWVADVRDAVVAALHAELGVGVASATELPAVANVLVLAVKPQHLLPVLASMAPALGPDHLVLSVAAGLPLAALQRAVPPGVPVVRAMPNTPCLVGAGASAFALGAAAGPLHAAVTEALLGAVGLARQVPEEALDAVTALSGSGPAYVFHLLEAMIAGGVGEGLDPGLARELALHTALGAAQLALASEVDPGTLRQRVMSPGGTTEAAIRSLDAAGFQAAVEAAIGAARARSAELAAAVPMGDP